VTQSAAGVVLDHTALLLLGRGHPFLSGLVGTPSHRVPERSVFVPALCLAAAVAERPAIGEHVLSLPAIEVVALGFSHALVIGELIAADLPWPHSHAVAVCRPDPEWPSGRPVVTNQPQPYVGQQIAVIPID
jgi:hypothetical protein